MIGVFAYKVADTGARGGIAVSPLGLRKGAQKIADAEGIKTVRLTQDSTELDYVMRFLDDLFIGFSDKVEVNDSFAVVKSLAPDEPSNTQ
jgi:hypothetical protein